MRVAIIDRRDQAGLVGVRTEIGVEMRIGDRDEDDEDENRGSRQEDR
jgi:hypothetical protein